jgi:hypothetical protein
MATKYIVDNLSGQTINGNLIINGNLTVTGTTNSSVATYKALLTQTTNITSTNLNGFYGAFIIGETYSIDNYVLGDDFSNIANVVSGTINVTGCQFIATGETPTNWTNGSSLTSSGNFVVTVLENNLGYDLYWEANLLGEPGTYFALNNNTGPVYNNFNRNNVSITSQITSLGLPSLINQYTGVGSYTAKDDIIVLKVYDFDVASSVNNKLYYTPIQVDIKQDLDTTPIILSGTVGPSFPFNYVSVDLICDGTEVESFIGDGTSVEDTSQMINQLNTDPSTSYLGTYSDGGSGVVLLSMPTNLVNQFCSNGSLTFNVFAD